MRTDERAQHERALVGGLHLEARGVGVGARGDGQPELLLEGGQRAELAREDEVEERPELGELVLDGRAREDEPVARVEALADLRDGGVGVADLVALVEHDVLPLLLQQQPRVLPHRLVRRDQHRARAALARAHHAAHDRGARGRVARAGAVVQQLRLNLRRPPPQLAHPLAHHRRGRHHDARPRAATVVERGPDAHHLQRLAEAHLVAHHAAGLLPVQLPQPLDAGLLVREEVLPQPARHAQPVVEHLVL